MMTGAKDKFSLKSDKSKGKTSGWMDESNTGLSPARMLFMSHVKTKVSISYINSYKILILHHIT